MFALSRIRVLGSVLAPRVTGRAVAPLRSSSDLTGWTYRLPRQDVPKRDLYLAEGIMGFMWYWILFHMWYDFGHIAGHFEYPDPSKWTDAELGIPPAEED